MVNAAPTYEKIKNRKLSGVWKEFKTGGRQKTWYVENGELCLFPDLFLLRPT